MPIPHVDLFDSTPAQTARFGGRFSVRVTQQERPDVGVEDDGLHEGEREPERGPRAEQHLVAAARRANVDVMFWPEAVEPNEAIETAWRDLAAFLMRL